MSKRKTLYRLLALTLCLITSLSVAAAAENPQASYLDRMNELCGTSYADGRQLTREEFCVCVAKVFLPSGESGGKSLPFEDAADISAENAAYISKLFNNGILSAVLNNGKIYMQPKEKITRQEAFTLLGRVIGKTSDRALTFSDSMSVAPWAKGYVAWFAENGMLVGYSDNRLGPADNMTADQLAVFFIKTLDYMGGSAEISDLSGTGGGDYADGSAKAARFSFPCGIFADKTGVVVFDTYNNAIRKIDGNKVETLAGKPEGNDDNRLPKGRYVDGALKAAMFNRPADGVFNSGGDLIICDSENNVLRVVKGGNVYTFSGTTKGYADGAGNKAKFNNPLAIAIDNSNNIYVADTLNNCIRKVDGRGNVTTIAGTPEKFGFADGAAKSALFREPSGIAVTGDGSVVYVADTGNHRIRKIENGIVSTVAGTASEADEDGDPYGGFADGPAGRAMFNQPHGITLANGFIIIADSGNNRIRAVTEKGSVITVAGNGEAGSKSGNALFAELNHPQGVCYYNGILYIADTTNNKIKSMTFEASAYE